VRSIALRACEILRFTRRALDVTIGMFKERLHSLAQPGEARVGAFAMDQRAAEFGLEHLDGARERGLRDHAALGRSREVQLLAESEEISDLVQFHGIGPACR
jgi:hypothetical protein